MVPPQQEEVFGVFHLVGQEEDDCLDRLLPPIDVVAEEEVVPFGREASVVEDLEQILELSVNITHDFDGRFQFQHHWLFEEHLSCHLAYGSYFSLG